MKNRILNKSPEILCSREGKGVSIKLAVPGKISGVFIANRQKGADTMEFKPDYCSQNNGDCDICSLVNYGRDCMNKPIERININGEDASIFYAVQHWRESGVCDACIDYRLSINRVYQDSYGDFHKKQTANCTCGR